MEKYAYLSCLFATLTFPCMPIKNLTIRPMRADDLPSALKIQSACYPDFLVEEAEAFASRFQITPSFCLAAEQDGVVLGYILAHGWVRQSPPAVGAILPRTVQSEIIFIHDLSVAPEGRGLGLGELLLNDCIALAADHGLHDAELIAVEGAETYWRTQGFTEGTPSQELADKVAVYGDAAKWMTRHIVMTSAPSIT